MAANVKRILQFAREGNDPLTQERFRERYGWEPDGGNYYYGLNADGARYLREHGAALRPHHRAFFDTFLASLLASRQLEKTVNLALLPFEPQEPFVFVREHLDLVEKLALELNGYQERAMHRHKNLEIVVRYASEMNDPWKKEQPWGRPAGGGEPEERQRAQYKETFALVRERFRKHAPRIRFTFSPAVRRDHIDRRYTMIQEYWPGDGLVDLVSCTWFVGKKADLPGATEVLQRYLRDQKPRRLPFALDEIGGVDVDRGNDALLEAQFAVLAGLRAEEITFEAVTVFLEKRWGVDATLAFLRPAG